MAKSKTKKNGGDINMDIIKRDAAQRREDDIKAHGKPTAFRPSKQKDKTKYNRKQKHKVNFATSDIMEMVEECIDKIMKGEL